MKSKNIIKKDWLITFVIVALALFFRLYKLEELFPFTMDESYQGFIVERIINREHFPLIGVNVADTGLYLGPFFSYFASFIFLIFKKNILGWALTAGLIGGLTTFYLIKVGQRLIGKIEGWLAGIFYAVPFLAVSYDHKFWNPSLLPLLSILFTWGVLNLKKNPKYWLLVFIILGLGFHTHFSMLLFWPVLFWYMITENHYSSNESRALWRGSKSKWFGLGIGILFFFLLPLILFDFRHNFLQTRVLVNSFLSLRGAERHGNLWDSINFQEKLLKLARTSSRLILVPGDHDLAREINVCSKIKKSTPFLGFGLLIPLSFIFLWKQKLGKNKKKVLKFITGTFLVFIVGFLFSPASSSEYYLLVLFPLSFLILAWAAELFFLKSRQVIKILTLGLLIFILSFNTWSNLDIKNSFGLSIKKQAILWALKNVNNRPYFLDSIGDCYKYEGYRYLFEKFRQAPVASFMDFYFSWLYPEDKKSTLDYEKKVIIFSDTNDISGGEKKKWQEEINGVVREKILADFGKIKVLVKSK